MKRRVILFNGPRRVGKDTAVAVTKRVVEDFNQFPHQLRVAEPLKNAIHALWGYDGVKSDFFEEQKDLKLPELNNNSPRELYIDLSEQYVKMCALYTPDHFGRVAVTRINRLPSGVVVVSDCGFDAEVRQLSEAFGWENVQLIRIHRKVEDGVEDSRGYVKHCSTDIDLQNDGTLDQFKGKVEETVIELMRNHWQYRP